MTQSNDDRMKLLEEYKYLQKLIKLHEHGKERTQMQIQEPDRKLPTNQRSGQLSRSTESKQPMQKVKQWQDQPYIQHRWVRKSSESDNKPISTANTILPSHKLVSLSNANKPIPSIKNRLVNSPSTVVNVNNKIERTWSNKFLFSKLHSKPDHSKYKLNNNMLIGQKFKLRHLNVRRHTDKHPPIPSTSTSSNRFKVVNKHSTVFKSRHKLVKRSVDIMNRKQMFSQRHWSQNKGSSPNTTPNPKQLNYSTWGRGKDRHYSQYSIRKRRTDLYDLSSRSRTIYKKQSSIIHFKWSSNKALRPSQLFKIDKRNQKTRTRRCSFAKKSSTYQVDNRTAARKKASQLLSSSIYRVTQSRRLQTISKPKSVRYCLFYNRYGRCKRGDKCTDKHDPKKVAVCTRFLRGRCTIDNCLFSHAVPADKMPVCLYYLRGKCTKQNCPYSHVKVNSNAQICQKFIKGLCTLGSKCENLHTMICVEWRMKGKCERGIKCPLKHPRKGFRARKNAANESALNPEKPADLAAAKKKSRHAKVSSPSRKQTLPSFISLGSSESSSSPKQVNKSPGSGTASSSVLVKSRSVSFKQATLPAYISLKSTSDTISPPDITAIRAGSSSVLRSSPVPFKQQTLPSFISLNSDSDQHGQENNTVKLHSAKKPSSLQILPRLSWEPKK